MQKLIVDLDGTITIDDPLLDYSKKKVNKSIADSLKQAKLKNIQILIYTARNMRTYNGDIDMIHQNTRPVALRWLKENQIPFDEIQFGKPWPGKGGFYVDDRALHPEEMTFRFLSYFSDKSVDLVVSFFNEGKNVIETHKQLLKVDRLVGIKNFIYVNNGSTDDTLAYLQNLTGTDQRVKIVENPESKGYGDGYRSGIDHSTSDLVITNHGDSQFDIYLFLLTHREYFLNLEKRNDIAIIPKRTNRPSTDSIKTCLLRIVLSSLLFTKLEDFNGQPKIFTRKLLKDKLAKAPTNFTFDLWMFLKLRKNAAFKVLSTHQVDRFLGESTWNKGLKDQLVLFGSYLKTAVDSWSLK